MKTTRHILLSGMFVAAVMAAAPSASAQQTTGTPGSPSATTTIDGKYVPSPARTVRRRDQHERQRFQTVLATDRGAAQGRAQRAADHDRRSGLRRYGHVWRRHPDAGHGPGREGGAALHAVPLHRAVFAHAGGADHRAQPSLRGLRRDHRAVHRIPGLRLRHRQEQCHDRHDPEGERLCHVVVRQES